MKKAKGNNGIQAKTGYHHGDLKEALIAAVQQLVIEKGAANFCLADACRLAGVSTAAPYRHFQDREEILTLIVSRAFDALKEKALEALEPHGQGSLEGIIAMGKAYVQFAVEQEALFRLMFGQNPSIKSNPQVNECGTECFGQLINQIALYYSNRNIEVDSMQIGIRLWTFVHGAASLLMDNDYGAVCPEINLQYVYTMIEETTPTMLTH